MRAERFEGTDSSGAVTVVVDGQGRVTDVVIAARWRDTVESRELGPALCAAANDALTARLVDEYEHRDLAPEFTPVRREDARDGGGDPAGAVAEALQVEIAELLVAFDQEILTYQRELAEAVTATVTGRSGTGAVEVTVAQGRVVDVAVNPTWAKSASRTKVRTEALDAFAAVGARLSSVDPAAVRPPKAIARLARLAADPLALNRELGLR